MAGLIKDKKKGCRETTGFKRKGIALLFAMLVLCCMVWQKASALGKLLYQESTAVYVGGTISLRNYVDEEFLGLNYNGDYNSVNPGYKLEYKWNSSNLNPDCATLDEKGNIKAISSGSVKADITFTYKDIVQTEVFTIEIYDPEEIDIAYGESQPLKAAEVYDTSKYLYTSSNGSIIVNSDGSITASGFKNTEIYVPGEDGKNITVAKVNIRQPGFPDDGIARAAGTSAYTPGILNYTPFEGENAVVWKVASEGAVSVSEEGLSALNAGETEITALISAKNGDTVEIATKLTITDPSFPETDIVIAADVVKDIELSGICNASIINWNIGNAVDTAAYFIEEGKLYSNESGSAPVTINADGRDITCNVTVTDPYYDGEGIIGYKGVTKNIKIKGTDDQKSIVTYRSKKKAVAEVDENGVITAKKTGNTVIVANADGREIEIPVEIASVEGYKASKKAVSISNTKTKYSQAKRMKKGYYDCSSLIWRIYSQYDVYFGVESGWAPTAADIAKWCKDNGRTLYNKAVPSEKLLPGDLVFFSYSKNGRYKNISHVEIYTGQDMDVSASSSNNAVIHYEYSQNDSIVMIARPVSN